MPMMDGITLLKEIKRHPNYNAVSKLILA